MQTGQNYPATIRYFGILASCNAKTKTQTCFDLFEKDTFLPMLKGLPAMDVWTMLSNTDPARCPECKTGIMKTVATVNPNGKPLD